MMLQARSTPRGKALRMVASSGRAWRPPIVGIALLFLAMFALAPVAVAGTSPQAGPETFDVYRPGVYSEQATWTWCTAASVQIMRNILFAETDHSSAHQQQFFDYGPQRNRPGSAIRATRGEGGQGRRGSPIGPGGGRNAAGYWARGRCRGQPRPNYYR